jgi:hypothetical protein
MTYKNTPFSRALTALLLTAVLSACGGGGGSPGVTGSAALGSTGSGSTGTTTPAATPTIAVSFANAGGNNSSALTSASPLTVKAVVKDATGKAVSGQLVAFTTDNTLAIFSPSAGTALTDATGTASVVMTPASLSAGGAGTVTASATLSGSSTVVTGTGSYSVGATALTLSAVTLSQAHIAAYGSTNVSVTLLAGGAPYTAQSQSISFSSACVTAGKATLAATVPTANGVATAVYRDQGCGATSDVISASSSGASATSNGSVQIDAPTAASIQFTAANPTTDSIVIKGQGGISRTETATLTFKVFDTFGNPLANQLVTFTASTTNVTLNKTSDSTDATGTVITTVNSGSVPTTFRVKAALANGTSTESDSIVVTTGLPVSQAFSLSLSKANIEGWTVDSGTTTPASVASVLLADASGNPVADGTPVVFQTNLGSIGSSSKGGCNTVNGGCSVDYRSQQPRTAAPNTPSTPCNTGTAAGVSNDATRAGVATICASTTDGTNTLFTKTALFLSGSTAVNVFLNGGATALSTDPINGVTDLGSVGATASKVISLQVNDINFNPMPQGTQLAVQNPVNVAVIGTVSPATVPNIFPHSGSGDDPTGNTISGNQGSTHIITLGTTQPTPCTATLVGTFNVVITSPLGLSTSYPFKLTFTCP